MSTGFCSAGNARPLWRWWRGLPATAIAVKTPTISTASGDCGRSMGGFAFSRSESKPRKWWTRKLRERGRRRRGHSSERPCARLAVRRIVEEYEAHKRAENISQQKAGFLDHWFLYFELDPYIRQLLKDDAIELEAGEK